MITVLPDNVSLRDLILSKLQVYILTLSGNLVRMQDMHLLPPPEAAKRPGSAADADESPAKLPATEPLVDPDRANPATSSEPMDSSPSDPAQIAKSARLGR